MMRLRFPESDRTFFAREMREGMAKAACQIERKPTCLNERDDEADSQ